MREKDKKTCRKLLLSGIFLLFGALALLAAARKVSGFAVWYADSVYPVLVGSIGRFFGLFPFSVSEIGLYLIFAGFIAGLIRFHKRPLIMIAAGFFTVSALLFSYAACCGVNYYRLPFSSYYIAGLGQGDGGAEGGTPAGNGGMDSGTSSGDAGMDSGTSVGEAGAEGGTSTGNGGAEDGTSTGNGGADSGTSTGNGEADSVVSDESLRELCRWLTEEVNRSRAALEKAEGNYENMQEKGVAAMRRLAASYPVLSGYYPRPKPVAVSRILSVQQYSGVYSPFTVEANYNREMVPYNIPHTVCHEMSHLRGFMREDEANFIGYLACIGSEDADFVYSGYMLGWIYAGNALARTDSGEYLRLHELLDPDIQEEFAENNAFWDRYEGAAAEVANQVNDTYLKVNGQEEGVKTYGRVVDLMLMDFTKNRKKRE